MKRLSRLTAVLLALVLTLSMSTGAWAETLNMDNYNEAAYEALYASILAMETPEEYSAYMATVSEEDYNGFLDWLSNQSEEVQVAYANKINILAPVYYSYTNAGPFLPAVYVGNTSRMATYALATASEETTETENGLILRKTATANSDGTSYTISLEAYVTGTVTTETVTTSTPCDIVLVLDMSNSMSQSFGSTTRIAALKTAVKSFIAATAEKYDAETADHRISIVKYNSSASVAANWTYVNAAGSTSLQNTVTNMGQGMGTNTHLGLETANTQLTTNYNYTGTNTTRQKVVILFTDGVPGTSANDFSESAAATAIANAKTIKDGDATVYSVAIYSGADPAAAVQTTPTNDVGKINAMLHAISSNYPNATATSSNNTLTVTYGAGGNNGYYLTASDPDDLNNIFQSISSQIQSGSASMQLDSTTVVKDIVSPYFTMPANTTDVTVQTFDCTSYNESTGEANWSTKGTTLSNAVITLDSANNSISITGFDFQHNYVAEKGRVEGDDTQSGDFYGRKIVITFTVSPTENFLGGNGVYTNGSDSAVYKADGTLVEAFTQPTVDVPVKTITPSAADQNIYLTNAADLTALQGTLDSRINGTNNDYVTITYSIKDGENVIATCTIPAGATSGTWTTVDGQNVAPVLEEDKTYTVECTVTPTNNGEYAATSAIKTANVYVYKPVYEFKDTTIDYLAAAPTQEAYNTNNKVLGPVWKHGETLSTSVTMSGTAPELTLTYTPESGSITDGKVTATDVVPVNVTVVRMTDVATMDITEKTTFLHSTCSVEDCNWESRTDQVEFLLHVINVVADLTITKTGLDIYAYGDGSSEDQESAIFTVTATDKNGTVQTYWISLANDQSVTIKDLRVNTTYTIIEQNGWTWRYAVQNAVTGTITRDANGNSVPVVINNTDPSPYWLGGDNYKVNVFGTN